MDVHITHAPATAGATVRGRDYRLMSNVMNHARISPLMISVDGQEALKLFYDETWETTLGAIETKIVLDKYATADALCDDISDMVSQRLCNVMDDAIPTRIGAVMDKYERAIYDAHGVFNINDRSELYVKIITDSILKRGQGRRSRMPTADTAQRKAIVDTAQRTLGELDKGSNDVVKKVFKLDAKKKYEKKRKHPDDAGEQNDTQNAAAAGVVSDDPAIVVLDGTIPTNAGLFDLFAVLAPHVADDVRTSMMAAYEKLSKKPMKTVPFAIEHEMALDSEDECWDSDC
jgi:hypothetical protein